MKRNDLDIKWEEVVQEETISELGVENWKTIRADKRKCRKTTGTLTNIED